MAGCEAFNYKVSLTVVQKGFEKSLSDGVRAIGQEGRNAVSRIQEILAPKTVEFSQIYERRGKRLHWEGDKHPVEYHLRCYTVWLTGQEASRGLVLQSKLDRQVWSQVEKQALQLGNGMAVQWLAFRGIDPEQGIALQQIENNNGVLRQTSRLLPFEKLAEIEEFLGLIGEERENIRVEVDSESGLSELAGWIVTGETINFHQDLPGFINQAYQPVQPLPESQFSEPLSTVITQPIEPEKAIPVTWAAPTRLDLEGTRAVPIMPGSEFLPMEPMQFRQLPEVQFAEPVLAIEEQLERQRSESEKPLSVAAVPIIVETPAPVFVANETSLRSESKAPLAVSTTTGFWFEVMVEAAAPDQKTPTRTDLVGQRVDLGVGKPEEKPELSRRPTRSLLVGKTEKQQLKVTVVEDRRCFPEKRILEKPRTAAIVFESVAQQKKPIYEIQAARGEKGKVEMETKVKVEEKKQIKTVGNDKKFEIHDAIASKISNVSLRELSESADEIKVCEERVATEKAIPIYRPSWQPAVIKDFPEWVWQGTAADPDEIIDWQWFLVTIFYALLNTKVLLKEKIY